MFIKNNIAQFIFILFILIDVKGVYGQDIDSNLDINTIDKKTYELYLKNDWKSLIEIGKKAQKNKIDFYYLDVRMGIAYYHLKKYRKAIYYLEKSFKKNKKNVLISEYLYYAYTFGGRMLDANRIADDFNIKLKQKLGIEPDRLIDAIGLDYKIDIIDRYKGGDVNEGSLEQTQITSSNYIGLDIKNFYKKGNLFYMHFGRLLRNYTVYNYENNLQTVLPDQLKQYQFYLSNYNQVASGLNLSLALNWLIIQTENLNKISFRQNGRSFYTSTSSLYHEIVGFAALRKDLNNFKLGLVSSFSKLNNNYQIQPGIEVTWYPLSNTNLYLYSQSIYKMEYDKYWENEFIFKTNLGFKLDFLYIESGYTYGNIYNFVDNDALIVYNDHDLLTNKYDLLLYNYWHQGHLKLFLKGSYLVKMNSYIYNSQSQSIKYNIKTVTAGILWKF